MYIVTYNIYHIHIQQYIYGYKFKILLNINCKMNKIFK